ncbi:MAG: FKBP-type peptidyl-prolyl cis-trans isomerase, partial [Lachnospiraceae bacterium]|nr:FKBP-type peptidyl-prolyl cis-trans isomerase [Lachnospiraceae bacterium]
MKWNKKLTGAIVGVLILVLIAGSYLYIPNKAANSFVSIKKYRHITVETNQFEPATDEELAFALDEQLLADGIYQEIRNRKVKDGDVVNIAFAGSMDGKKKQSDLSHLDYNLEIGSHTFIDGFEQGLVGKKPGKKVKLKLMFPLTYPNESYAGHKVVFDVKINYIMGKYTKETLTDEAVNVTDYDTAAQYIKETQNAARTAAKQAWNDETARIMWNQLIEKAEYKKIDQKLKKQYFKISKIFQNYL